MANWPTSLPQVSLVNGFALEPQDLAVAFNPEVGPPMSRRRGTAAGEQITVGLNITPDGWTTLYNFYKNTLKVTGTFNWKHPITGAPAIMKFMSPPKIPTIFPGAEKRLIATMQLLILP